MLDHRRRASDDGEPLVLLHFQGGDTSAWDPVADRLEGGYEIWQLAFPGYGTSPLLDEPHTLQALARSVASFMADNGVHRFHVAGCSLGGGVALELGRLGAAESVCALSPASFQEGADAAYLQAALVAYPAVCRGLMPLAPALRLARFRKAFVAQMAVHADRWPAEHLEKPVRSVATAPGFHHTRRDALTQRFRAGLEITCPVTVAWAEHDRLLLTARHRPRAMADLPQAEHLLLTGCGHLPFWDDPDQVAEVVIAATARRGTAGGPRSARLAVRS
jgi:pimeloyl-ACP methyl ester carboxylesterase